MAIFEIPFFIIPLAVQISTTLILLSGPGITLIMRPQTHLQEDNLPSRVLEGLF